jgi:hypothetical protein
MLNVLKCDLNFLKQSYSMCSCIIEDLLANASSSLSINEIYSTPNAYSGVCNSSDCNSLSSFLLILFFITLLTALNQMPTLMVTLRSVSEIERPFALGLQLVIMRILGKQLKFLHFFVENKRKCHGHFFLILNFQSIYTLSINIWPRYRLGMSCLAERRMPTNWILLVL